MSVYFNGQEVGPIMQYIPPDTSANQLKGVLDGSLKKFDNKDVGLDIILSRRFEGFTQLESLDLNGITQIPDYLCNNCTALKSLVLDPATDIVNQYAFYSTLLSDTNLHFSTPCAIGTYAFYGTSVSKVSGNLKNVQSYGFYLNKKLKEIDVTINGSVGQSAFCDDYAVEKFRISPDSNITGTLGNSCFRGVGSSRPDPANNVFELDFTNSTFSIIDNYAFGNNYSSYYCKYYTIHFPKTLVDIKAGVFMYSTGMRVYFHNEEPPTLSYSSLFNNAKDYKIFVKYGALDAYKVATNWSTYANDMIGFESVDLFEDGQILPEYNKDGYKITWYTDENLTEAITNADKSIETKYYYCTTNSEEQIDVVSIDGITAVDCNIKVINKATNHAYVKGEGIPVGTEVSIVTTPTIEGYIPYTITLNEVEIETPYNFVTESGVNLALVSIYYDGINDPVNLDFAQNSWALIKKIVQEGKAAQYWKVGDTKPVMIDGYEFNIRIVDLQTGRYDYSDGSGRKTNAVFESVETHWNYQSTNPSDSTNAGGFAECKLRTWMQDTLAPKIDKVLYNILEEIEIPSINGGGANYTGLVYSSNKIFLASIAEIGNSNYAGNAAAYNTEGTTWAFYDGKYPSASWDRRIKYLANSKTNKTEYWLRTPIASSTRYFCRINTSGYATTSDNGNVAHPVPICFAW